MAEVKIVSYFQNPLNSLVAAAKTCYSNKGIIFPEDIKESSLKERSLLDTFKSGHHTLLQHAHFKFALKDISRLFVWSFLHSHPYYNSEQVSQRYVEVREGNYYIPDLKEEARQIYLQTVKFQIKSYKKLKELLFYELEKIYRGKKDESLKTKIKKKKSLEFARYVLPLATYTYLYHTISLLTLVRYYKMIELTETPSETKKIVNLMVEEVLKVEPDFKKIFLKPFPIEESLEFTMEYLSPYEYVEFSSDFDRKIAPFSSKLIDFFPQSEEKINSLLSAVLGIIESSIIEPEKVLNFILSPQKNRLLSEIVNLKMHSKIIKTISYYHYTFAKRLSLCADSQNQRHRTISAIRPILLRAFPFTPDYYVPQIIKESEKIYRFYTSCMEKIWEGIKKLESMNVSRQALLYLLPNATFIRVIEWGNLSELIHKYQLRLCYNAQEEIWRLSLEEVQQIMRVHPTIGKYLFPSCTVRMMGGVKPFCPEGKRFCGKKVWKLRVEEYERLI